MGADKDVNECQSNAFRKYRPPLIFAAMSAPTRILIIRLSSIGDIVLTTPVIRRLHNQLDGPVEIHYLTKKSYSFLLENNPMISRVHTMERSIQEVIPALLEQNFDYVIDLHSNIRSRIVKRRLNVLSFTFKKLNIKKWIWVNLGINLMPPVHIVDRYMEAVSAFSIQDDGKGLDFFVHPDATISIDLPSKYIAVAIGAAHDGKRMDADHWTELLSKINKPVVLIGGKEDTVTGNEIQSRVPSVINLCGKSSIDESALIVKNAEVVLTGDTGMMHIASAFQKKIISLWGCTVPGFGMSPYRPNKHSVILEPLSRKKRPCSKLGNRCKYGMNDRCIFHIHQEEILFSIEKLWAL